MMFFQKGWKQMLLETVMYAIAWLLLLEWIYPVGGIADLTGVPVLILFSGWCFAVSLLVPHWWMGVILKGAALLLAIQKISYGGPFIAGDWINELTNEIGYNLGALFTGNWQDLSELFRVLLILILIWLMSYLLHYWFVLMKRTLLFVMATIVYVSLLSTFVDYDAEMAIVRIVLMSVITFGLSNILKIADREIVALPEGRQMTRALGILSCFVLVVLGVAAASPSFTPQWPDPVPRIQQFAEGTLGLDFGGTSRRVGYGEDDSELGGSFAQDYSVVFKAIAPTDNYWRIETKDFYTGKGWKRSVAQPLERQDSGLINLAGQAGGNVEPHIGELQFATDNALNKLLYPYGMDRVDAEDEDFYLEPVSEAVHIEKDGKSFRPDSYKVEYSYPTYDIDRLRKAKGRDPEASINLYTQLPEKLPGRVATLAEGIVSKEKTRYDKVKAVEQYFNQNGFAYETTNIPVPKANEDYVDQFLFDTKAGYCDNFSTSMVVMLRTQGIPARWVKGFTSGEKIGTEKVKDQRFGIYEVTNANAHSWVEVYFPENGWVPFEPTQGFSNAMSFTQDAEAERRPGEREHASENQEKRRPVEETERPDLSSSDKSSIPDEKQPDSKPKDAKTKPANGRLFLYGLAAVIIAGLIVYAYGNRWKLRTAIIRRKLKQGKVAQPEETAYRHALDLLAAKGYPKAVGETLGEYATRMKEETFGEELMQLTAMYEELIYGGKAQNSPDDRFISSWERLMCLIIA